MEVRKLTLEDIEQLDRVAPEVFDEPVNVEWSRHFLTSVNHHIFVAIDADVVVGMITAVHYVHPDKPVQLWINEVGVAPSHQRRGIGRQLLRAMLDHGRALGCKEAWLGTEEDNVAARGLYEDAGSTPEPFVLYAFNL